MSLKSNDFIENRGFNRFIGMAVFSVILITLFTLPQKEVLAQTENVGIGTTNPSNSAVLELSIDALSVPRGFLVPRMTTTQRNNIPGPVPPGLLIYNTDNNRFEFYSGTTWLALIATGFTFADISSGTNTTASMVVGNGASLTPTGTGYITANRFVGSGSTSDNVDLATAEVSGVLPINRGGTNLSSTPTNGQLLIGDGTGFTLNTLTAGSQISINNAAGSITISSNGESPLTFANGLTRNTNNVLLGGALNQNTSIDIGSNNLSLSVSGNSGDVIIGKFTSAGFVKSSASGVLSTGSISTADLPSLASGQIWIGNASNQASAQTVSGAGSISNAGVLSINDNAIGGNHINLTGNQSGDLMYYDGTDWVRLPAGTNGQVLKTNAGIPSWGTDENTTYTAGAGLNLNTNEFSVNFAGSGTATTAARSDHSHSITSNISATPWRLFYSDASGAINELALGSNGTVLQSTGNSSAPTWANVVLPIGTDGQTLRNSSGTWEATSILFNNGTNIGIGGITSPVSTLHQDAGTAEATYHKFTAGTTTGQATSDGFDIGIDASGNAILRQRENLPMIFHTNNSERMRILNDGRIGFGVTSPSSTYTYEFNGSVKIEGDLEVTGEIDPISLTLIPQSTTPSTVRGKMYFDDADNVLKVYDGNQWTSLTGGTGSLPTGSSGQTLRHNGSSWVSSSNIFNDGTNTGIGGITSPVSTLHQDAGTAEATYHKFTAGTTTGQTASDGFDIGIDASGNAILRQRENLPMIFHTNNSERMRILNDGRIGFGVTSPSSTYTYEFNGSVKINGDLEVTGEIDPISLTLLPQSSTPSAVRGKIYFDEDDNELKVYDGNQWASITGGTGSLPTGSSGQTLRHDGSTWVANDNIFNDGTNVGIGTTSPNVTLDIDGALALRRNSITLNAGSYNDLNVGDYSFIRLNQNGNVTINGISGGYDGKILIIYNASAYGLTINHNNTAASAQNRIWTHTGAALSTSGTGTVVLIYDGQSEKWITISYLN